MSCHKTRCYSNRWSTQMTENFIDTRILLNEIFIKKQMSTRECWECVAIQCDIDVPWLQLRKHWTNLLDKYKRIRNEILKSNRDVYVKLTDWPFYDKMHGYSLNIENPTALIEIEQQQSPLLVKPKTEPTVDAVSDVHVQLTALTAKKTNNASKVKSLKQNKSTTKQKVTTCDDEQQPILLGAAKRRKVLAVNSKVEQQQPTFLSQATTTTTTSPSCATANVFNNEQRPMLSIAQSNELFKSTLKTDKELRKAARSLTKFLSLHYNIKPDSSDSE